MQLRRVVPLSLVVLLASAGCVSVSPESPRPVPAPAVDELCAAAEGSVPPSIVDLCLRQAGR